MKLKEINTQLDYVSTWFKKFRNSIGLNPTDFSSRSDISVNGYRNLESSSNPQLITLLKLTKYNDISINIEDGKVIIKQL